MAGTCMLSISVVALLLAATTAFDLTDLPPGKIQTVTTDECHWICGKYGQYMECAFDEMVTGQCGSQSWANCENNVYCAGLNNIYAAIKCCKVKVTVEE